MSLVSNVTTANSVTQQLGSLFGVNNWQLTSAKYCGCTFAYIAALPILQSNPIANVAGNVVATVDSFTGGSLLGGEDLNGFGKLYNTTMGIVSMREEYFPLTVVKPLPYANKANLESMGGAGYEFFFSVIFLGQDYQKAVNNIENVIKDPQLNLGKFFQLEHPTRGLITGLTKPISFRINTAVNIYNGCMVEMGFRSEECNIGDLRNKSIYQKIFNAITDTMSVIQQINATIATLKALLNRFTYQGGKRNSPQVVNKIKTTLNQAVEVNQSLYQSTNYIYKNSETGVQNSELQSTPLNTEYIPKSLAYGVEYNATQGSIIIEEYNNQVTELVANLTIENSDGQLNNLINLFHESLALLYEYANLAAQIDYSYIYEVPYTMSLYSVLSLNNIPLNQAASVWKKNPNLQSANYITQGTKVFL